MFKHELQTKRYLHFRVFPKKCLPLPPPYLFELKSATIKITEDKIQYHYTQVTILLKTLIPKKSLKLGTNSGEFLEKFLTFVTWVPGCPISSVL